MEAERETAERTMELAFPPPRLRGFASLPLRSADGSDRGKREGSDMSKTGKAWALGVVTGVLLALCFVGVRDGCAPKPESPPPTESREKIPAADPDAIGSPTVEKR